MILGTPYYIDVHVLNREKFPDYVQSILMKSGRHSGFL